ncbi:MAG: histidinol-phosphate aminotransferase family protein [Acidimicrobiia bacterium]|nr:histidinol-phosphate aminotransferase family protein [Acidimicrobiia bacterium]
MSSSLMRPEYEGMDTYNGIENRALIDLGQNTNRWGMNPAAKRALLNIDDDIIFKYPTPYGDDLKDEIAKYVGVNFDQVSIGSGSYDHLDTIIRACSKPGQVFAISNPSLPVAELVAKMNCLNISLVDFKENYSIDTDALVDTGAQVIFLCSPNNPTGTIISAEEIIAVIERAKGLVILDEAYSEFSNTNYDELINKYDNLVILRTFSKAFGLAGMRIGYALASNELTKAIEISRGIFKTSALSEYIASQCLQNGVDEMKNIVNETIDSREKFIADLKELSLNPIESEANFVLVPFNDAQIFGEKLFSNNISVRVCIGLAGIGDALRITIGPKTEMALVIEALRKIL